MTTGVEAAGAASAYATASDPDRMKSVLGQHLRAADGSPVEVITCEVVFARRGESRSLFQYRVSFRDPAGGSPRLHDITAVAYGSKRGPRTWERVRRQLAKTAAEAADLVPAAYVPDLDLLVQVFPFDHQMPALASLASGPWAPVADPLLSSLGSGDWRIVGWEAEVVRYRVDLRATLHLRLRAEDAATGRIAKRRAYAKAYGNPLLAERAWRIQCDLAAALAAGGGTLALAPVVAWLPDDSVLVQDEVAGTSLFDLLASGDASQGAMVRVARALATLHQLPIEAPPQAHDLERTGAERVRRCVDRIRESRPDLTDEVNRIEDAILAGFAAIGDPLQKPVHGDLKPAHALLDGERVTLLDLDKFAAGEPMLDVVSMVRGIGPGRRRGSSRGGVTFADAFIEEYFAHVPAGWRARLAPNYAAALVSDASKLDRKVREVAGRHRRGAQPDRADALLAKARAVLTMTRN